MKCQYGSGVEWTTSLVAAISPILILIWAKAASWLTEWTCDTVFVYPHKDIASPCSQGPNNPPNRSSLESPGLKIRLLLICLWLFRSAGLWSRAKNRTCVQLCSPRHCAQNSSHARTQAQTHAQERLRIWRRCCVDVRPGQRECARRD